VKLILASASPRRADILRNCGFSFEVIPAHVDETRLEGETAAQYVLRVAQSKAQAIADRMSSSGPSALIIGADTAVVIEGGILGKPADAADARRMLRLLTGKTHEVLTGIAVIRTHDGEHAAHVESTSVTFVPLSREDIDAYIATGEPFDKAGAYGIQGLAGKFASRIEGCYFNVMGLPVSKLWQMLSKMDYQKSAEGES
jgi:septum formation protein